MVRRRTGAVPGGSGMRRLADVAALHPLHPLRYTPFAGDLSTLTAPPYDVIDAAHRESLRAANPFNAVRLELPEVPYEQMGAVIGEWVERGAFARTAKPGMVAWTQTFTLEGGETYTRRVVLAAVEAEAYETRQVRPHERTHAGPKEDRLRLLYGAGHQISPVYGLYPDREGRVWSSIAPNGAPDAQFVGDDRTINRIWWVDDPRKIAHAAELMKDRWILIADGHHRYETAVRYRQEQREAGAGSGPHDMVMMGLTAIEDPGLVVLPTHRVLAKSPGPPPRGFDVEPADSLDHLLHLLADTPVSAPAFGLVTPDGAAVLTRPPIDDPSPAARLDVAVLERLVLQPAYGRDQAQLSHDGALTYEKDTTEAWRLGSSGEAAAVFILRDMPKSAVTAVAEAGETMPQKSTYFFPKLPTGVAFHPLREPR